MSMKDYSQPSWSVQQPNVGVPPLGPAQSPVKPEECKDGGEAQARKDTCEIKLLLRKLLQQQSDQNDGITNHMPPPWAIWAFPENTAPITISSVAQGGPVTTTVFTVTIAEGYYGSVEHIGLHVIPETACNDITWQVKIDSRPVPWADNIITNFNSYYNVRRYRLAFKQRQTVAVFATNNGPADLLAVAQMTLWYAPMRKY